MYIFLSPNWNGSSPQSLTLRAAAQTLRGPGVHGQDKGCQRFRQPPRGLTMKRKLAPAGLTLLRSSLWRFTYSLINFTSSSCGNKSALKPEVSSSSQSSQSHSFKSAPGVRGSHWTYQSSAKGLGASMVHRPRTGQCARAGPPHDLPIQLRTHTRLAPPPQTRLAPPLEGKLCPCEWWVKFPLACWLAELREAWVKWVQALH